MQPRSIVRFTCRAIVVLVGGLLLMACHTRAQPMVRVEPPHASVLPPIPDSVLTMLGPIPVLVVDSLRNGEGRLVMGGFHPVFRVIYLQKATFLNATTVWQTLEHERCHAWLWDSGLQNLMPEKLADALCDAVASMRVADMLAPKGRK